MLYSLNYIYFLLIVGFALKFLFQKQGVVVNPLDRRQRLLLTGPELFWVLTFSTGLLAFSARAGLDLMAIRLLSLELLCLLGLFLARRRIVFSPPVVIYILYLLWMIIGIAYTPIPMYGVRVVLKYLYPLLVVLFASEVVKDKELFIKASLGARTVALVCMAVMFLPFLQLLLPGVFWYATAAAINFISMAMFSLGLYFYAGRDRKDLLLFLLFCLPCVIFVFRTSIMGTALAVMVFFFFRYRLKSLPAIALVLVLFVVAIFTIPSIKEKMFIDSGAADIENAQEELVTMDNINSNGRFAMWEWSLKRFYHGHELIGSGTGHVQKVFNLREHPYGAGIPHNDYLQMLCDNGLVGVTLWGLMVVGILVHCFIVYWRRGTPVATRLCAVVAAASLAGVSLTAYTDNAVNYTMATFAYPFGFYGMMLGLVDGNKKEND